MVVVDDLQGFHQGQQQPESLLQCQSAAHAVHIRTHIDAVHIFHDNVGSGICLNQIVDAHNTAGAAEPSQSGKRGGLPDKPVPVGNETIAHFVTGEEYGGGSGAVPDHNAAGVEFLDGHGDPKELIPAYVGDTKAALTQHSAHQILIIQHRAGTQLMGGIGLALVIAAVFADGGIALIEHTAQTSFFTHSITSLHTNSV